MIVNCFTITAKNNCVPIDIIHKDFGQRSVAPQQLNPEGAQGTVQPEDFGDNIPKYLQYEGGNGCTYLCCVDVNINVLEICERCNYLCGTIYQIEIDDNMYNNNYIISPTYSRDGEKFKLLLRR